MQITAAHHIHWQSLSSKKFPKKISPKFSKIRKIGEFLSKLNELTAVIISSSYVSNHVYNVDLFSIVKKILSSFER